MQDDIKKNKDNFDADFMNTAWNDMHTLLDVEMPVEQKPTRRFFFWWFSLGAASLLIFSLWVWNNDIFVNVQEKKEFVKKLDENKDNLTPNVPRISMEEPLIDSKDSELLQSDLKNSTASLKSISEPVGIEKKNIDFPNNRISLNDHSANNSSSQTENNLIQTPLNHKLVEMKPGDDELIEAKEVLEISNLETQELKPVGLETIEMTEHLFQTKSMIVKSISKFTFGLEVGLLSFDSDNLGASIGADVSYRFSKKWFLNQGVDICNINSFSSRTFDNIYSVEKDIKTSTNAGEFTGQGDGNLMTTTVNYYASFPLTVNYIASSRWSVYSGVSYNYVMNSGDDGASILLGTQFRLGKHFHIDAGYAGTLGSPKLLPKGIGQVKVGYRF